MRVIKSVKMYPVSNLDHYKFIRIYYQLFKLHYIPELKKSDSDKPSWLHQFFPSMSKPDEFSNCMLDSKGKSLNLFTFSAIFPDALELYFDIFPESENRIYIMLANLHSCFYIKILFILTSWH